jgi:hypothetical protein
VATSKKIVLSLPVLLLMGSAGAFVISGGDFSLIMPGLSSAFAPAASSGGDFSVVSSVGQSAGTISLSGGDYSISGGLSDVLAASSYLKTDLSEVIVFPNPFKPGSGGAYDAAEITFRNLTRKSTIKIFNIAGELVKTIEVDNVAGEEKWNAKNDSGEKVASGVYIYYVSTDGGLKAKGKFAIIK